jgi:hypothetical protein
MAGQRRRCKQLKRTKLAAIAYLIFGAAGGGPHRRIWLRSMELRNKEEQYQQDLDLAREIQPLTLGMTPTIGIKPYTARDDANKAGAWTRRGRGRGRWMAGGSAREARASEDEV